MSMHAAAQSAMYSAMRDAPERRPFTRETLRRIFAFAAPHRRRLVMFLLASVATAAVSVTPRSCRLPREVSSSEPEPRSLAASANATAMTPSQTDTRHGACSRSARENSLI